MAETRAQKDRVAVAMSGGVDSAGAALLLRQQGYAVEGVTLQLLPCGLKPQDPEGMAEVCAARAEAEAIGVPHTALDRRALFDREVMERFSQAYQAGRTPNPCVDCNREVKFGSLMDWAMEQGFRYLATGHYARVRYDEERGRWLLLRGRDLSKDQSYVLYQFSQEQLAHLLLPVGEYEKPTLRALAEAAGVPNAQRQESQDICFVPDGDYVGFLRRRGVELVPGDFVDREGRVLGRHRGLECYTIGQRKGLGVSAPEPLYVLGKDMEKNQVILGPNEALMARELVAERPNWISIPALWEPLRVEAKARYRHQAAPAVVEPLGEDRIRVVFDEPQRALTPGQAVVLYQGEEVVGGATIVE